VKKAKIYLEGLTIHLQDRLVLFSNLSYNDLVSATIDQERLMKVIADADERKRKMMMSVSSGSGGSSGAFLKYRMVYTPPPPLRTVVPPSTAVLGQTPAIPVAVVQPCSFPIAAASGSEDAIAVHTYQVSVSLLQEDWPPCSRL
jgi:hypothetical protein